MKKKKFFNQAGKRIFTILLAGALVLTGGLVPAYASDDQVEDRAMGRSETVFVELKDQDQVGKTQVSVRMTGDGPLNYSEKSNLKGVENLKGKEQPVEKDGRLTWKVPKRDLYYSGVSDQDIPMDYKMDVELDGKPVKFSDLEGKSGHLKIKLSIKNKDYQLKKLAGKEVKVYRPYLSLVALPIDFNSARGIKVNRGHILNDGLRYMVTSIFLPGMRENLALLKDYDKIEKYLDEYLAEDLIIEADIEDYIPAPLLVASKAQDLSGTDLDYAKDLGELKSSLQELLDGGRQLEEGAQELAGGTSVFSSYMGQLAGGTQAMKDGVDQFRSGVGQAALGASQLKEKVGRFKPELDQYKERFLPLIQAAQVVDLDQISGFTDSLDKLDPEALVGEAGDMVSELKKAVAKGKEFKPQVDALLAQFQALDLTQITAVTQSMKKQAGKNWDDWVAYNNQILGLVDQAHSWVPDLGESAETFRVLFSLGRRNWANFRALVRAFEKTKAGQLEDLTKQEKENALKIIEDYETWSPTIQSALNGLKGLLENLDKSLDPANNQSNQLVEGVQDLNQAYQDQSPVMDAYFKSVEDLTGQAAGLAAPFHSATSEAGNLDQAVGQLAGGLEAQEEGLVGLSKDLDGLTDQASDLAQGLADAGNQAQDLSAQAGHLAGSLAPSQEAGPDLSKLSEVGNSLGQAQAKLADLANRLDLADDPDLANLVQGLQADLGQAQAGLEESQGDLASQDQDPGQEDLAGDLSRLAGSLDQLSQEVGQAQGQSENMAADLDVLTGNVGALSGQSSQVSDQVHGLKEESESFSQSMTDLTSGPDQLALQAGKVQDQNSQAWTLNDDLAGRAKDLADRAGGLAGEMDRLQGDLVHLQEVGDQIDPELLKKLGLSEEEVDRLVSSMKKDQDLAKDLAGIFAKLEDLAKHSQAMGPKIQEIVDFVDLILTPEEVGNLENELEDWEEKGKDLSEGTLSMAIQTAVVDSQAKKAVSKYEAKYKETMAKVQPLLALLDQVPAKVDQAEAMVDHVEGALGEFASYKPVIKKAGEVLKDGVYELAQLPALAEGLEKEFGQINWPGLSGKIDQAVQGTEKLSQGVDQLADGAGRLAGASNLLADGAGKLANGLALFMDQGINKLAEVLEGESGLVKEVIDLKDAIVDVSASNRSFTGYDGDLETDLRYVVKIH